MSDGIKIFTSVCVPEGTAYAMAPITPDDEDAMKGLSLFERVRWLAEHGKIVKVVGLDKEKST